METIRELIECSAVKFAKNISILKNKSEYDTYEELRDNIKYLGTYFLDNNFQGKKVAIIGSNCYEWALAFLAVSTGVGISVPIDKELTEKELLRSLDKIKVDYVLYNDYVKDKIDNISTKFDVPFINMKNIGKFIKNGKEKYKSGFDKYDRLKCNKNDLAALFFTSGTSSNSKVVMLSQNNITFDAYASSASFKIKENDRYLSILPMSHTFELIGTLFVPLVSGCSICFNTSLKNIKKELLIYKPTAINCVPRVLEFFVGAIRNQIKINHLEKKFLNGLKICNMFDKFGINIRKKVFKEIHKQFGGNIRMLGCGGAKLDNDTFDYLNSIGFEIYQGYGLTETSPIISIRGHFIKNKKSVGKPVLGTKIKIINKDKNGIGKIIVKGPQVMLGYYHQPKETKKIIKNGWLDTGDLGIYDEYGCLNIVGRDKNVIIANNGKNVYPEEIEEILNSYDIIKESIVKSIKKNNITVILAQIVLSKDVENSKMIVSDIIKEVNKDLATYKHIGKFEIMPTEFDKTTTMKIRR